MGGPTTYAEWCALLDNFGKGGDTVMEELKKGSFKVDAGTASRFYSRVEEVYKKRKQFWLDNFQRSFQFHLLKNEDEFDIALRNGKQNLYPLLTFVSLPAFPEDLRKTLKKDLEDFVLEIKGSLKTNISKVSNGREKMLILLNSFGLFELPQESPPRNSRWKIKTNKKSPPTGRKIIF